MMHKKIKRTIILLLAVLIAAAAPMTALAEGESIEQSMETALISVKSLVDIDDDVFIDFSYSSSFSNYETREGLTWTFSWSDNRSAIIYAEAAADGTLLQFNKYDWGSNQFGFALIDTAAAVSIADDFIQRANPDTYRFYGNPANVWTGLTSNGYTMVYNASVDGHAFEAAVITINVNKFSGEVTGYYTRNVDPGRYSFESAVNLITPDEAIAAYADKIGLNLEYRSFFSSESRSFTVFPVYLFGSRGDRFISATTGDIVEYVYDLGSGGGSNTSGGGTGSPQSPGAVADEAEPLRANITPAERAAIEQVTGFMSSEQALEKLLEAAELTGLDTATFNEQHIGLNRDYLDSSRFFYDVNMFRYDATAEDEVAGFNGRVEALTGRVMSFSIYYSGDTRTDDTDVLTEEQVEAAVAAFLDRLAPAELEKSRLESTTRPTVNRGGYTSGYYSYSYLRYENDIIFRDNGISVTLDQNTGKVTRYMLNWYDNITFPVVNNVLTPQQALAAFIGFDGIKTVYITTGGGNAALVYDFNSSGFIDPYTGTALDYTGQPRVDDAVQPTYNDVNGHWSEYYVMKLLRNGVFMWGDPFDPEKDMTELEFLQYIMLIEGYSPYAADVRSFYASRGVNVEADANTYVTRQEAARIIVEYLGYGRLAERSDSYVYPFTDSVDDAYKGFITICYILDIVGGFNGRFDPTAVVTRAEAAVLLHNLILTRGR